MSADDHAIAAVTGVANRDLSRQERVPDQVFSGSGGIAQALRWGADWIWLLDAGAVPRPDALAQLLAGARRAGEVPASLLAGTVVGPAGEVLRALLPSADQQHPDLAGVVGRRLLPIRTAPFANCLVSGGCFARHGLPDEHRYGPYAARTWTARVLRDGDGYLVATSVAVMERGDPAPGGLRSLPAALHAFRAGALTRGEALRELSATLGRRAA